MKKLLIIFISFTFIFINNSYSACDDPLGDGVDYSFCQFSEEQDLSRAYAPNSDLSFISFIKVNLDKSILMNTNLSNGNFAEASFFRANLYEANFKDSNLFGSDFTGANITNATFDGANLNNSIWIDGAKCNLGSIGVCKK